MAFPQFEVLNDTQAINIARTVASAANGMHLTVTDTCTSGTVCGLKVQLQSSGNGPTYRIGEWIDYNITGNTTNAHPIYMYCGAIDDKTISNWVGIYMYVDDIGDSVSNFACLGLETNIESGHNATEHCFIRFREHDTVNTASHIFRFEGANAANFLLWFDAVNSNMLDSGATAGDQCVGHIKIKRDTATAYINVYSDNS